MAGPSTTITVKNKGAADLCLLILERGRYRRHTLPAKGELILGRASDAGLVVDDESVSRHHAKLRFAMGKIVTLEDLGSANGTRVDGRPLGGGERVELSAYDVIELGQVHIVVQPVPMRARTRHFCDADDFFRRLAALCARAGRNDSPLSVIRIEGIAEGETRHLQQIIVDILDDEDVAARIEGGAAEMAVTSRTGSEVAHELRQSLPSAAPGASVRIATFPVDGKSAEDLLGRARGTNEEDGSNDGRLVVDASMKKLYALAAQVAVGDISVLIQGETGTGKQVLAEHLHRSSRRSAGPLVEINCGALSEALLESELFGHVKGAFTGAARDKPGLFEAADGGTLFLDEIGDMPSALQVKLLRVLEDGEVRRVGAVDSRKVDVRVVAATHVDIERAIGEGEFREDLYYRLSGIVLEVPPLRRRPAEVVALFDQFIAQFSAKLGRKPPRLSPAAQEVLQSHSWPGNIRELRNVAERASLVCSGDTIVPEHLPAGRMRETLTVERPVESAPQGQDRPPKKASVTREQIVAALEESAGNQTRAAERLGVARRTLTKWLSRYDIPRPRKGP